MKLLLDEQTSGKVAERLGKRDYDVVATTADGSLRGLSAPDLFEVAQEQGRAMATYNRADFEAIVRGFAAIGREHDGLIIIHPVRFPSRDFARLAKALARFLDAPSPGRSFIAWLQDD